VLNQTDLNCGLPAVTYSGLIKYKEYKANYTGLFFRPPPARQHVDFFPIQIQIHATGFHGYS
jgi:hypothetical protein